MFKSHNDKVDKNIKEKSEEEDGSDTAVIKV
jgi:hypothetical protein